jgi:hypothetical protein
MAWPNFHREMESEVENQVAAPAETRTPNLHRANKSLTKSADGRVATGLVGTRSKELKTERKKQNEKNKTTAPFPS